MLKKLTSHIVLVALIATLQPFSASAQTSTFPDVPSTHNYSTAIEDLYNRDIIEGYPDGRFGPNRYLNRAELTKIIIESLDINASTSNCFPDVPQDEWFNGYVCIAKDLGWIEGYPDGTFKPAQLINHAEAVKIIAKAEEWSTTQPTKQAYSDVPQGEWYAPYVTYSKESNFLPFSGSFKPAASTTRGEFAEIYHRIIVTEENDATIYAPAFSGKSDTNNTITPDTEVDPNDIQVTDEIVNGGFSTDNNHSFTTSTFDGMTLDQNLPKVFYNNEIYYIDGELNSDSYNSIFAFIYPKGDNNNTTTFKTTVSNGNFSIPVRFNQPGEYYIGIISGTSGSSKVAPITIRESIPNATATTAPTAPTNVNLDYEIDQTAISFSTNGNLRQVKFSQSGNDVIYLSRQTKNKIPVVYSDFKNFNNGAVSVTVSSAIADNVVPLESLSPWSTSPTKSFTVTTHEFTEVSSKVSLNHLPTFFSPNQKITLSGNTTAQLTSKFSVILPNGFVESNGDSSTINAGNNFSFDYTPTQNGVHILEINDTNGIAVVNHPIYPNNTIPLIPNYFDNNPLKLNSASTINETTEVNKLLNLINAARTQHNLPTVTLNSELSALARAHSQDMADNDFFGHVNLEGQSPNDRRVAAGIKTIVGENIARTTSTEHAHEGFMRSAIHRDNVLDPTWTQVGLGIVKDSDGYFFVSEEFSTSEGYSKDYITDNLNDARNTNFIQNNDLTIAAQNWSELMAENNFINTSHNGQTIFDSIEAENDYSQYKVYIVGSGSAATIAQEFLKNDEVTSWTYAGIGLATDNNGTMKATLLLAQ